MTILKRSSPSILQLSLILRLQTRQLSAPPQSPSSSLPLINASNCDTGQRKDSVFYFSARWFVGVAIGSSLGLLYWSSTSNSNSESAFFSKSLLSFADRSTSKVTTESAVDDHRCSSGSLFRKLSLPDYNSKFLLGEAYRRKVFFNYEKRIRLRSPPEKVNCIIFVCETALRFSDTGGPPRVLETYVIDLVVNRTMLVFEYFASSRTAEGELLMKPTDLMRAIVPVFPPSESHLVREGYLKGERSPGELRCAPSEFFMLFDTNNDGLISFKEYIFFVTLLGIPESSFSVVFKMFDIDNNGEIDKEEFKKVMALMRAHNRLGAFHSDGLRTGPKVGGPVENGGLVEYFFGEDGRARLQLDKFVQFMRGLHDEMLRLEFAHYDYKLRGSLSAEDFALSLVASADMSHLNRLLNRVDQLKNEPHLRDIRITFEEFKNFAELRRKLQPFSLALFSYGKVNGLLTRKDLQRAAYQVCGILLTDNVIDIIFHVFDSNRDGTLSSEEFISVLHERERDIAQPVEAGMLGLLSCWNCANDCSTARLLS